jgi:hypothetical protein
VKVNGEKFAEFAPPEVYGTVQFSRTGYAFETFAMDLSISIFSTNARSGIK